jgi:YtcA family
MRQIPTGKERGSVLALRRMMTLLAVGGSLSVLAGCARSPTFNILGSFFPAWLICMMVGIVLAAITKWVLTYYKLDKKIVWTIVVYPCLAGFFACTLWLIFFS